MSDCDKPSGLCLVAILLTIIGAINWGLVGFFGIDLVAKIFGAGSTGAKIVYDLVGIAGVLTLIKVIKKISS